MTRNALFIADRPIGFVDGKPVRASPDFANGLQALVNLLGGANGLLPDGIGGGTTYGISYVGPDGGITSTAALTDGQVPIGDTGGPPVPGNITGTANRVTVTNGPGTIALTTPQDTHTGATPTFAGLLINGTQALFLATPAAATGNTSLRGIQPTDLVQCAGTYTPTLTNVTNVAASAAYQCQFIRVGATVIVTGKVDIDPTGAGQVQLGITLPVASNFGATEDCGGAASCAAVLQSAAIYADVANDRAMLEWVTTDTANRSWWFTFGYQVI